MFALMGMLLTWVSMPVMGYKGSVKHNIFPNIFSFFGDDYHYSANGLLPVASLKPSDIIPNYDDEHTEDYVKGSHKNVSIELNEARMTETTGSGKDRRTTTVFNGIFIRLGMNKRFKGKTIIKRDGGRLGNWLSKTFQGLENVQLEDLEFEKIFQVFSNDQVEARYLLTTSFIERLRSLTELFGGNIQASFYDDRLLFMLPSNENRFETASIFVPATFVEEIHSIRKEMEALFQIIDVLKLDQHTGL